MAAPRIAVGVNVFTQEAGVGTVGPVCDNWGMSSWEPVVLGLLTAAVLIWVISKMEALSDALKRRPFTLASTFFGFSALIGVFLVAYWDDLRVWVILVGAAELIVFAWAGFGVLLQWPGFRDVQRLAHWRPDLASHEPFVPIPVPTAAPERGGRRCSRPAAPRVNRMTAMRYEDDLDLGRYLRGEDSWAQTRVTEDGREFEVRGYGPGMVEEQIQQWSEIDRRLPELVQTAIAAVVDPGPGLIGFSRSAMYLSHVWLQSDGSVEVALGPCLRSADDGGDEGPVVEFRDWQAVDSYWST